MAQILATGLTVAALLSCTWWLFRDGDSAPGNGGLFGATTQADGTGPIGAGANPVGAELDPGDRVAVAPGSGLRPIDTGYIVGRIVDRAGQPIANASVSIQHVEELRVWAREAEADQDLPQQTESAGDGVFRFDEPPDSLDFARLVIENPRFATLRSLVEIRTELQNELGDFVLGPYGGLAGLVVDGWSQPVANALLRMDTESRLPVGLAPCSESSEDGTFRIEAAEPGLV